MVNIAEDADEVQCKDDDLGGIQNPENFCLWNPESRSRNPESQKTDFLESGIH